MATLGVFCFPGTGHLNPMLALARRLQQHGHRVIFFGIADTAARVLASDVEFRQIGSADYPVGTLRRLDDELSRLRGLSTFRFTVDRVKNHTRMVLRDGPSAVQRAGVDALLVDEADLAGSVAEHLHLPFVSIACFPPLVDDAHIPPFCFGWGYGASRLKRLRNRAGALLLSRFAAPVFTLLNAQRCEWGLPHLRRASDALSPLAQITQLPASLDFPFAHKPPQLHHTGPFVDSTSRPPVPFPWELLDDRPLLYASLGTLQNGASHIFRRIAEAAAGLDVQLVLSLGGGNDVAAFHDLPGSPIVVKYAPQLELLKKAAAVVTHAGLNTTLESLAEGVPLVAIPLGNDQPGVAARIAHHGAGVVVSPRWLTASRLRAALMAVLTDPRHRAAARKLQAAMHEVDALESAADLVERALGMKSRAGLNTMVRGEAASAPTAARLGA
jgi:zeaxanthin glucosyltransferase